MILFGPVSAIIESYKELYIKYTGQSKRTLTIKRELFLLEKGAIGVCYAVRGPKMFLAFREDGGKQVPRKEEYGGWVSWKHHLEVYPFDEPNAWEIELDL